MRFVVLGASVLVQLCLGGVYAWSTFAPDLHAANHLTGTQTQFIFGVQIAVFTLSMVPAGRLLAARGPRLLLVLSGVLFFAGYRLAAASGGSFPLLLLGIGGLAGVATGLGYVCPLSVCMKWFPTHRGLVTGIAVAGFGAGAIVLTSVAEYLLEHGVGSLTIFRHLGLVYGAVIVASGALIASPERVDQGVARMAAPEAPFARDPFFWALVAGMFSGTFAGLLVIGNLKPLAMAGGISPALAATGVGAFALGNTAGRIVWGRLADKSGPGAAGLPQLVLGVSIAALLPATAHTAAFLSVALLVGFGFGACFIIYAALLASRYGADEFPRLYPFVFLAYGAAGISGPTAGGWLFDRTGGYAPAIGVSVAVLFLGLIAVRALLRTARRASAPH